MLDSSSGLTASGSREYLVKLQLVAVECSREDKRGYEMKEAAVTS